MKPPLAAPQSLALLLALPIVFLLIGCGRPDTTGQLPPVSSTSAYNPGYGPFDKNGNYIEAWADKPARQQKWSQQVVIATTTRQSTVGKPPISSKPQKKPIRKPPPVVASRIEPKPKPPAASRIDPKPDPPKPVAKPKPATRHTVVKGDTLYSLGRRYGTSVGAIQRANGLDGTLIRIGQSLRIPN